MPETSQPSPTDPESPSPNPTEEKVNEDEIGDFIARQVLDKDSVFFEG